MLFALDKPATKKTKKPVSGKGKKTAYSSTRLFHALDELAKIHNIPFSKARILRGLPADKGNLTLDLFPRAAANLGLEAEIVSVLPSRISAVVYPVVLFFNDGKIGIATGKQESSEKLTVKIAGTQKSLSLPLSEIDQLCMEIAVYATPEATANNFSSLSGSLEDLKNHWLWSAVTRFWPTWLYVALAALVLNLLGLALPLFVMNVYDRVIPNNSVSTLWALAAGVVLALVFDFVLRIVRSKLIDNTSRRIDMGVSSTIFEQALDAKMAGRNTRAGELANQVREFESVRDFFTSSGLTAVIDLMFVGIFLAILWIIVGPLALVALFAVPVILAVTLCLQIPLARSVRQTQETATNRHSILVESLVGIETIKAVSAEGAMQGRWEKAVAGSVQASSATHFWSSLAMFFTMLVQQSVSVIMIIWGVFLIQAGEITIGALIASNILAGRVLAPIGGIAMTVARAQQSFSAYRFLNSLMSLDRDHGPAANLNAKIGKGRIEFRDVKFSYPHTSQPALDGISLGITPGERIGVVGRVGSGKSTLGKLLCGLYETENGAILIDDTDTRHYAKADLRAAVGYVNQETELFNGTLKDNILLANPKATDLLETCSGVSGVAAFAQTHPLGYEMQVGERGKEISGGQRQSVGIARTMIADPKIIYFDEPTSQMDNLTEAAFIKAFKNWISPDTTLLVATHRTSLLDLVSRLIIIDRGRIVADGPKDKVLASLTGSKLTIPKKGK